MSTEIPKTSGSNFVKLEGKELTEKALYNVVFFVDKYSDLEDEVFLCQSCGCESCRAKLHAVRMYLDSVKILQQYVKYLDRLIDASDSEEVTFTIKKIKLAEAEDALKVMENIINGAGTIH